MIDETRGSLRIRSWPKPRGQNRHPTNVYWTQWLQWATYTYRYAPAKFKFELEQATKGTPWMPRDIWIAATRATAFLLQDEYGRTYYPMSAKTDISESLDVIAQLPGEMLWRSSGLWVPIPSGAPGQLLVYTDDDTPPTWTPPTSIQTASYLMLSSPAAKLTINVNSTAYIFTPRLQAMIDTERLAFDEYLITADANSNAAGQTIAMRLCHAPDPTVPIGDGSDDVVLTNTAGRFSSGWRPRTATLPDLPIVGVALKGSNSTVDLDAWNIQLLVR